MAGWGWTMIGGAHVLTIAFCVHVYMAVAALAPAPDHRSHLHAMYRIDPAATDRIVRVATRSCLRGMLPESVRAEARISERLIEAYANGLAHMASWRESAVPAVHERKASTILARDQQAYNASFDAMTEGERAVALTLRARIVGGDDPYPCIFAKVAAKRWSVYYSDTSGAGLRGTVAGSTAAPETLRSLANATIRR